MYWILEHGKHYYYAEVLRKLMNNVQYWGCNDSSNTLVNKR